MMDGQGEKSLIVYDEFVARHEAAYTGFVKYYTLKNPPPEKQVISRDVVSLIIIIGLAVVMVASIIVSGTRTVAEFGGAGFGTVAFVMIEGGIMMYAFFRARRSASPERLAKTVRWATAGLIFTLIVGLGANIDSELRSTGIVLPSEVTTFIKLLVAVSAPALAFISSDVLAIELMSSAIRQRQADKDYQEAKAVWLDGLNRSWASQQKQWGVGKIEIPQPVALPLVNPLINETKQNKTDRKSPQLDKALDWLKANPGNLEKPSRELVEQVGVSYITIFNAQRILLKQQQESVDVERENS